MNRDFTDGELRRLFRTVHEQRADVLARRDLAWMKFLNETGMRITEFSRTTKGDAHRWLTAGRIYIPAERRKAVAARIIRDEQGKEIRREQTRRAHDYLLNKAAAEALRELLAVNELLMRAQGDLWDDECSLVVARTGAALSVRSYQARLKHWAQLSGLPDDVSPHWFRHTKAQRIKRETTASDPYDQVAYALGQSSKSSARQYSAPSRSELENEATRLEGLRGGRVSRREFLRGVSQ